MSKKAKPAQTARRVRNRNRIFFWIVITGPQSIGTIAVVERAFALIQKKSITFFNFLGLVFQQPGLLQRLHSNGQLGNCFDNLVGIVRIFLQ